MKKILVGLLVLGSCLAFADNEYECDFNRKQYESGPGQRKLVKDVNGNLTLTISDEYISISNDSDIPENRMQYRRSVYDSSSRITISYSAITGGYNTFTTELNAFSKSSFNATISYSDWETPASIETKLMCSNH